MKIKKACPECTMGIDRHGDDCFECRGSGLAWVEQEESVDDVLVSDALVRSIDEERDFASMEDLDAAVEQLEKKDRTICASCGACSCEHCLKEGNGKCRCCGHDEFVKHARGAA